VYLHLHDKKGADPDEWPNDLRVREFPAARESFLKARRNDKTKQELG
jgi:hypothetical protein